MFIHKLLKTKKNLEKILKKRFINSNNASFISLILFVIKFNEELRFCVNYRKLNALIKRNRYSILLIKKTLTRVISRKYLIKFNIIVTFNKLRMHLESENFIIFIIFIRVYKYYVFLFKLINNLASY